MEINVVYSANSKYCKLMAVSILSVYESNKDVENLNVVCLLFSVENEIKNELKELGQRYNRNIILIDVDNICEEYRFWEMNEDSRYVRLLLPIIINNLDKVLYLDCDTIVRKPLVDLFSINISNYSHAAVLDTVRLSQREEAHIKNNNRYFNSGVMLINLSKWRKENIVDKFKDFKLKYNNKGTFRDQRVLNGTTSDNYYILPPNYNLTPELLYYNTEQIMELAGIDQFYSEKKIKDAILEPVIVHFAGRSIDRPWFKNCDHPFCEEYRNLMTLTKFTSFKLWQDSLLNILKWKFKRLIPFPIIRLLVFLKR